MTKVMPCSSFASCSPPSRPLRAAFGGGLRPALTAVARDASKQSPQPNHREKHHQPFHGRALLHNLTDTTDCIMRYTPELYALTIIAAATALMWVPYVLARLRAR